MSQDAKLHALKQYFGYDSFRQGQEHLIDSILSGADCLGVMPTGAGKSVCYQLPALLLDGITLVISPLISLMKDQVNALTQAGIKAAYLNSSLTERQHRLALENAEAGLYKMIYVAPERLDNAQFMEFAAHSDIAMVTVDEAHCISQWGQDFRPSYLKIRAFVDMLPKRPVLSAFTATATPKVREDILSLLQLDDPCVLITGFDRTNLFFEVRKPRDKDTELLRFLSGRKEEAGIVYCSTRNAVDETCCLLQESGYAAARYHAGIPDAERHMNQDDFMLDKVKVIVATNAFGMGIDKSNVRYVVHYNMPKDIESYYQEAGRAGRDGSPAACLLLYSGQDVNTCKFLIENSKNTSHEDEESLQLLMERDLQRLKAMTYYCHTSDCLRAYILRYFGEKTENYCGGCANCLGNFETCDITVEAQKILSCVVRMKERYGIKMIVDVLRGSRNEKIQRLGLDKLSTYGICKDSEKRLRDMIHHLILRNYLAVTDGEYPVVKLGSRATEVLRQNARVEMKLVKDADIPRYESAQPAIARQVDMRLFARLAALRTEIAKKRSVPAYSVFTDSTLTDMCIKLPSSKEEFQRVSGVGQAKLERYGEAFLKVIAEFAEDTHTEEHRDASQVMPEPLNADAIEASDEPVTVSAIADRINCELIKRGIKKLTGAKINAWLMEKGYLQIQTNSAGKDFKLPTAAGTELGIIAEEREIRGQMCWVNLFGKDAQRFVFDAVEELMKSNIIQNIGKSD